MHTKLQSAAARSSFFGSQFARAHLIQLLVEVVFSMAKSNPPEVGDVVSQLLDVFHLLVQEVGFNEISHLGKKDDKSSTKD